MGTSSHNLPAGDYAITGASGSGKVTYRADGLGGLFLVLDDGSLYPAGPAGRIVETNIRKAYRL